MGNGLWLLEEGVFKVGVSNLLQNLNMDYHSRRPHTELVFGYSPIFLDCGGVRCRKSTFNLKICG